MIAQTMPARRGSPGTPGSPGIAPAEVAAMQGALTAETARSAGVYLADIPGTIGALTSQVVDVPIEPVAGTPRVEAVVIGVPNLLTNLQVNSAVLLNATTVRVTVRNLLALGSLTGGKLLVFVK